MKFTDKQQHEMYLNYNNFKNCTTEKLDKQHEMYLNFKVLMQK